LHISTSANAARDFVPPFVQRYIETILAEAASQGEIPKPGSTHTEKLAELYKSVAPDLRFDLPQVLAFAQLGLLAISDTWIVGFHQKMPVTKSAKWIYALQMCFRGWSDPDSMVFAVFMTRIQLKQIQEINHGIQHQPSHIQAIIKQIIAFVLKSDEMVTYMLTAKGKMLRRQLFELNMAPDQRQHRLACMHTPHHMEKIVIVCANPTLVRCAERQVARLLHDQWGTPQHGAPSDFPACAVLDGWGVRGLTTAHFAGTLPEGPAATSKEWKRFPLFPMVHPSTTYLSWGCPTGHSAMIQTFLNAPQTRTIIVTHDMLPFLQSLQIPLVRTIFSIAPHAPNHAEFVAYAKRVSAFQHVWTYNL
jgi:hypothetical protein